MFRNISIWLAQYIWCDRPSIPSQHGLTASVTIGRTAAPPGDADLHLVADDEPSVRSMVEYLVQLGTVSHVEVTDFLILSPLAIRRLERLARRSRRFGVEVKVIRG